MTPSASPLARRPAFVFVMFVLGHALAGPSAAHAGGLVDVFPAVPWGAAGTFPGQALGSNIAPAGDVNGDGFGDIVASVGNEDTSAVRAVLYLGGPDGPSPIPAWTYSTGPADSWHVRPAGDVNGDGFADILLSRPFSDIPGHVVAGRVAIFHGGPGGLPAVPNYELFPPSPADALLFGAAADFAGDVNGDGFADVVVSTPLYSEGGIQRRGAAYIYHGGPAGLAAAPARTLIGPPASTRFGETAATAGDVNADGFDDIIIGAPEADSPFPRGGIVLIFHGSASGIEAIRDIEFPGVSSDAFCGASVSTAGDVNGDGYADVLFGSPGDGNAVGRADIAFGGPDGAGSRTQLNNPNAVAQERYGLAVATLGDTDGDGYADFAVAGRNAPASNGHAIVFSGGPTVFQLGVLLPPSGSDRFAESIGPSGDVDGDGLSEILVADSNADGVGRLYLRGRLRRTLGAATGWPLTGPQLGTRFGNSLAIVQTRSFLALPRLVIGDPQFDGFGRVTEYQGGGPSGLATTSSHTLTSNVNFQGLGTRVADAGDFDGDGWGDYVVSSPTINGGTFQTPISQVGRVDLVRGGPSTPAAPVTILTGSRDFDRVGSALAGRGDVNGDGYHDVLIGAREADTATLSNAGKAWVVFGGPAPPPPWMIEGGEAGQGLGAGVALLDFDGDGYTDVAIGSTSPFGGPQLSGKVQVHYGSPSGPENAPGFVLTSSVVTFGSAVAALGDVNGDGVSDLGVGAPLENNFGVARVYAGTRGRSQSQLPIRSYVGDQAGGRMGEAMAGGGDIDGDGFGELAIGQPGYDGGQTDEGRAHLYFGALHVPEAQPTVTLEPNLFGAEMGASLAPIADVNADGVADWIVGAPGAGRVFVGLGGGSRGRRHQLLLLDSDFSALLHSPAHSSSDHILPAALFPHGPMGRTRMGLQFEVRTQNEIFTGVPTITTPLDFEVGVPEQEGAVSWELDIPLPGRALHLRAREYSRSPYFQRSAWVAVDGRSMGEHDVRFAGTSVSVDPRAAAPRDRPSLRAVTPNPAAGTSPSRIAFSLPRAARVRVDLHDVRGARVRRLFDGEQAAGETTLAWDGLDDAGRTVPPGIYFVALAAEGTRATARLVRMGGR